MATKATGKTASKTRATKAKEVKAVEDIKVEEVAEIKAEEAMDKQPEQPKDKTYTEDELNAIIAQKIAEAMASANANANASPNVVQIKAEEEMVKLLFVGAIAVGTSVDLGNWGQIFSDGGMIDVPKRLFVSGINATVNSLLKDRKLIVVDGLTDGERERYGVLYKDNELLTATTFGKLLDYDAEHLGDIYKNLCDEHKKIVARVVYSAVIGGDRRVNNEKIATIVRIDRARGVRDTALDDIYRRTELAV